MIPQKQDRLPIRNKAGKPTRHISAKRGFKKKKPSRSGTMMSEDTKLYKAESANAGSRTAACPKWLSQVCVLVLKH